MSMRAPGPGGGGHVFRSFQADPSVAEHKLRPGTVRRILSFARPYRGALAVFLTLVALDAAISAVVPLLIRNLLDDGVTPGRRDVVVGIAAAIAALALLSAGLSFAERWISARIGEGLILDLRSKVFDHVQSMPVAFFSRTQTGALVQRLNGDVLGAQQAFTSTLSTVVSNVLTVVLVLAAMASMSWQLTAAALVLVPLFVLPARWVGRRLAGITTEAYTLNAAMSQTMTERFSVAGALHVKLFSAPERESAAFMARAARVRDIGITRNLYASVFRISMTLLAAVAVAVVYGVGGLLAISGGVTVGVLVALAAYLTRLYGPITALSNVQVDVMSTLVSFERVLEVLDLAPTVTDAPDAVDLAPTEAPPTVELDRVSFAYPAPSEVSLASLESVATLSQLASGQTLHEVSFRIEPGQTVALVGPSGAGKTTVWQLLARLYDVTGGAVRIDGHDVREVTQSSLQATVGVVTQDAHMFHDTIRANLLLARPDASDAELRQALEAAQIGDLVRALPEGLDTVVGDRGYRLSGGERQRLAIARLLLKAPRLVVLDEATAHLDSESEHAVQAALAAALRGRTGLVIAHRLSTVRSADRIVVLDGGRVVQQGSHDELLAAGGLYAELYRTQFAQQTAAA